VLDHVVIAEWEGWDTLATDSEHPVTRGLHVRFRARGVLLHAT
jgi:hypothetical protein